MRTALLTLAAAASLAAQTADIPAFSNGARILFQGDSITDMNRGRTADPNHILGHSYAFLIAARYGSAFPERHLTFLNRGVSGNTVADLIGRWQSDTLALKPDVLSILIGINDLGRGVSAADFERQYDQLLADTVKALPDVRLVLGEPFALRVGQFTDDQWAERLAELRKRQATVARLAARYHAALVRYQKAFDAACERAPADYWIWDGIHPTYSGQQIVADEWLRTVAQAFWRL
jgi:lysophospholipase L1-like esterase